MGEIVTAESGLLFMKTASISGRADFVGHYHSSQFQISWQFPTNKVFFQGN